VWISGGESEDSAAYPAEHFIKIIPRWLTNGNTLAGSKFNAPINAKIREAKCSSLRR
jgi:hypothetical protein